MKRNPAIEDMLKKFKPSKRKAPARMPWSTPTPLNNFDDLYATIVLHSRDGKRIELP
jgi:hypothetical protein